MYPEYMTPSLEKVAQTRNKRFEMAKSGKPVFPSMTAEEREDVLTRFHPDYKPDSRRKVRVGPNKGEILTTEISDMLESHSRIKSDMFDLSKPDFETDVLISRGRRCGVCGRHHGHEPGCRFHYFHKAPTG